MLAFIVGNDSFSKGQDRNMSLAIEGGYKYNILGVILPFK